MRKLSLFLGGALVVALPLLSTVTASALELPTGVSGSSGSATSGQGLSYSVTAPSFQLANTPRGYYVFTSEGTMAYDGGRSHSSTFQNILSGVQSTVVSEVKSDARDNFSSPNIEVSLTSLDSQGYRQEMLWGSALNLFLQSLPTRKVSSGLELTFGSQHYDIYIPAGATYQNQLIVGNQRYIDSTVSSIDSFVSAVQDGVLAGSLASSYNTFSLYPSSEVAVNKVLSTNSKTGAVEIDNAKSGITLNYSLVKFYNPIFGAMTPTSLNLGSGSEAFWGGQASSVALSVSSIGHLKFPVSPDYKAFVSSLSSRNNTYTLVKQNIAAHGVGSYHSSYSNSKVTPVNLVNSAFQLVTPYVFSRNMENSLYQLDSSEGFKLVRSSAANIKLDISNNYVYSSAQGKTTRLGSYAVYNIDPKSLVLTTIKVNSKGELSPSGVKEGAVLPLWYDEGLVDFGSGSGGTAQPEATGRLLKFGQDFSGKLTLDGSNADLFSVSDALDGILGTPLRNYAFPEGSNYLSLTSQVPLATNPAHFQLAISFENTGKLKGFYLFLNDHYADDPTLANWLQSSPAKALLGSEATKLYDYVTGVFKLPSTTLSYQQWQRLQEIKSDLSYSNQKHVQTLIAVVSLVFGVLLIFYSVLLLFAYWFDLFNALLDFSFLNILTRGRLYPIASSDSLDYVPSSTKGAVKYVTFRHLLVIVFGGIFIGTFFVEMTPVLRFLTFMYFHIKSWVGGI